MAPMTDVKQLIPDRINATATHHTHHYHATRTSLRQRRPIGITTCFTLLVLATLQLPSEILAFTPSTTKSLSQSLPLTSSHSKQCNNNVLLRAASTMIIPDSSTTIIDNDNNEWVGDDGVEQLKLGVFFLNLGGPEKTEDVEGFLYNLFADPDIIRLPPLLAPLQDLIALFISKRRAPQSTAAYESIGGGSPILKYTKSQCRLVQKSLEERYGLKAKTYIGMRYWYPFTEEALAEIQKDGIEALVIIPLYPQFSISTSGSSLRLLQEEFARRSDIWGGITHTVVPQWYERPGYVRAMADLIINELESFTDAELQDGNAAAPELPTRHILFSAHGVPRSYIDAGDPYRGQILDCVDKISQLVEDHMGGKEVVQIHLSFQSRVGPIEWLRPYTDDVLPELGAMGVKNLVVVPISFVSEHIETLEEIDMEYRELAEENGIDHWRRCPALNTDATFIDDMADMVVEALNEPSQSVTEVCVANNVELGEDLDAIEGVISSGGVGGVGAKDVLIGKTRMKFSDGERINGRIAIFGVLASVAVEVINGKPLLQFFHQ